MIQFIFLYIYEQNSVICDLYICAGLKSTCLVFFWIFFFFEQPFYFLSRFILEIFKMCLYNSIPDNDLPIQKAKNLFQYWIINTYIPNNFL